MAKVKKENVKHQMTQYEREEKERSKQKMNRDCEGMIRQFKEKQVLRKNRKAS
jgi:hypothetical protein